MEEHKQTFSTAIKLLHSKHKDSGDNLLRLVDDLIQKRYGADRSVMKVLKEKPHLLGHGQGFQEAKEEEEDKKPPPAGSSEPPPVVYLDNSTSSSFPGVISIPDEPSSSLLELERDFEASVSGLDAAALPLPEVKPAVTEANTEASTAKPLKPGRGRKKRLPTPAKRERSSSANILDEVLTLMDKTNGKVPVKPPPTTTTTEGVPAARAPTCSLCSDGAMAKAVTCRRCLQTFLLCCVEMSAPGFDPGAWLCGYCLLRCRQSTDPQLWSCPLPSTASFRKVTAEEDVAAVDPTAGEKLQDRPGCGKRQKQSSSPEKLRRGTRLRKYL